MKLFLETSIGINEQDDEGRTALMLAAQRGHSAVVAELVRAGADVSLKDKNGMSAVLLARSYDVVHQLGGNVDDLSREDRSRILWHACNAGDLSMVRSVIEAGCDVDHIHNGQTPVIMATLRGHDSIVKELILANCDVNFRSGILCREMVDTVTMYLTLFTYSKAYYWTVALVCGLLPWMQYKMEMEAALWIDPIWSPLVLLAMVAILGIRLMPESWIIVELIRTGMFTIAIIMLMKVATTAGPVAWTVCLPILAIPLVTRIGTSSVTEGAKEFAINFAYVAVHMCTALALLFVVPKILVWSPRDITGTELVVVALIEVAIVVTAYTLLKRMVLEYCDIIVAVLEGVILNVEIVIIASSCMMIGRKAFVLHESQAVTRMVNLLLTAVLLTWFMLMVLRIQNRGAAGFLVFEGIKLFQMDNSLSSPDKPHLAMVLVVLLVLFNVMQHVARKVVVVVVLHLVVAMIEAYLALIISKTGGELRIGTVNLGEFVNLTVGLAMATQYSFMVVSVTSLHYAASYNSIKCGVLLIEGGADVFVKFLNLHNPMEIGSGTFQNEVNVALSFTTKRVISVIGNSECGKSTLVTALEHTSNIPWKKATNYFRKVHHIRQRTAGIEAVPLSNQKYGEALIYDFAGQSQYHGPHQTFLEAMLSKPEVSVTLLLLVKATEEEDIVTQQLHRWLQPLAQRSVSCTPQVIVVGSFLDQVKSEKEARAKLLHCMQSVQSELCLDIQGLCLLDCRYPESRGIDEICRFLQEVPPVNTHSLSYDLHWVLVQV